MLNLLFSIFDKDIDELLGKLLSNKLFIAIVLCVIIGFIFYKS